MNSAGHNKPQLIRGLLSELQPPLYNETTVRKELIREVEMGPFKHTVDDGLDLRKVSPNTCSQCTSLVVPVW